MAVLLNLILLLSSFLFLPDSLQPLFHDSKTTNCDQKFTLFFKLAYEDIFWIGEDLYGECGQSSLLQVFVAGEKTLVKKMELAEFERWDWIDQARKAMRTEKPILILPNADNKVEYEALGIKLRNPKENYFLKKQFDREFAENCAYQWNQKMQKTGIDEPQTWDLDLDLVYYYANGLYFNYQIEKVYVFPESNLLCVMTYNENRCAGSDTMHGFLIFRFKVAR
jgi:hypothetical protein